MGNKIKTVILVLLAAVFVFSGVRLYQSVMEYKTGTDEYDQLAKDAYPDILPPVVPEGFQPDEGAEEGEEETETAKQAQQDPALSFEIGHQKLREINGDYVGWIAMNDIINYPVVQGSDNEYYLTHTFNNTENSAGSIFMETLNSADFSDVHTILYGHNMKNGSMFGTLMEYESPSYLVAHPLIFIDTEEGSHAYKIFSCYRVDADSDSYTIGFKADEMYVNFLKKLKERSAYDTGVEVTMDDKIITLSTCTNTGTNRYLVHAKKAW